MVHVLAVYNSVNEPNAAPLSLPALAVETEAVLPGGLAAVTDAGTEVVMPLERTDMQLILFDPSRDAEVGAESAGAGSTQRIDLGGAQRDAGKVGDTFDGRSVDGHPASGSGGEESGARR